MSCKCRVPVVGKLLATSGNLASKTNSMENGKRIKELRLNKGMTQTELAHKTEVSARTIQRIENGEVNPHAHTLQMIAKALEVDFTLFAEKDTSDKKETQELNNDHWLGLLHLSGILPVFFPTLILWNLKKSKTKVMAKHFRATLSMQLSVLGICIVGLWVYWNVNQLTPFIGALVAGGLVAIVNAINVMNDKAFINPFIKN
jgi:transcriptional regulator with XRE-family HTH domain